MIYDYSKTYECAGQLGLYVDPAALAEHDREFAAVGLTQAQVDAVMSLHFHRMIDLFDAGSKTWKQRLGLAAHFLSGRSLMPRTRA